MPSWGRYAMTVYLGLLMAGALGRPPMAARSASQHDGGSGLSAKLAPLKAPYRYPDKTGAAASPADIQHEPARETARDVPRPR